MTKVRNFGTFVLSVANLTLKMHVSLSLFVGIIEIVFSFLLNVKKSFSFEK